MKRSYIAGLFGALALILLILDAKTAIYGMSDAINLCLTTVVPSLFPFFVLTTILTGNLAGARFPFLRPFERMCRMGDGTGILLVTGLLGGYPAGAQVVADAYHNGRIRKENAQRLLGFCSNAGPAFIFGILAGQFRFSGAGWLLWAIHITACLITGYLLPGSFSQESTRIPSRGISFRDAVEKAGKCIGKVCIWICVFRVILSFADRWFLWLFDPWLQVMFTGATELTLGCTQLSVITNEGFKFVLCCAMLAFGGICVTMQTASCVGSLGLGFYLRGKILQTVIAALLAWICQYFVMNPGDQLTDSPLSIGILTAISVILCIFLVKKRKMSSNPATISV